MSSPAIREIEGPPPVAPRARTRWGPGAARGGAVAVACPECGAAIEERFCGRCGEARPVEGGLRLRHVVGELVEHLTSLDFKLVRTLVTLVRRPGQLTRDFVAGRRGRYVRPLALYLLVSGAFFLAMSHAPITVTSPRDMVLKARGRGPNGFFESMRARTGETRVQLADRVAASPLLEPRTSTAFLVPVLAGVLALLHAGRRRLLAEHVLLAIHLQTFLLVLAAGTLSAVFATGWVVGKAERLLRVGALPVEGGTIALVVILAGGCVLAAHLHAALRRVYGLSRPGAAWRAVALAVAVPMILAAIRMLLILGVAAARWR